VARTAATANRPARDRRRRKSAPAAPGRPAAGYFDRTRSLAASIVYILPLLALYELGLILFQPPVENGVGVALKLLFAGSGDFHTAVNLALLAGLLIAVRQLGREGGADPAHLAVLIVEAVCWAFLLTLFAVIYMEYTAAHLPAMSAGAAADPASADATHRLAFALIISAGAGVYEELIFRVVLLGGLFIVFRQLIRIGRPADDQRVAALLAVGLSALIFAMAHHIGPQPPPDVVTVTFRTTCGIIFGVIYLVRGLAVAVYAHTIYNLYVFMS
jgi:membrane protease YdiL (CAAX protease family)